jgi:hypothetical protein
METINSTIEVPDVQFAPNETTPSIRQIPWMERAEEFCRMHGISGNVLTANWEALADEQLYAELEKQIYYLQDHHSWDGDMDISDYLPLSEGDTPAGEGYVYYGEDTRYIFSWAVASDLTVSTSKPKKQTRTIIWN